MLRASWRLILVLLVAGIGVGIYAYYTTPLPYGLGAYVQTPAGEAAAQPLAAGTAAPATARTHAGQPLVLGAASVSIQSVERNQDLTANNRGGPPGVFTVLHVVVQNSGSQPLTPQPGDFRLVDDQGRVYAVDPEATRAVSNGAHRRVLFDASVPPGASIEAMLAFETPADISGSLLRVTLGYGDLELPR